ncbi:unnamed protein product [Peniophora sp. CBMAI 1063]|nr:unnamed protein product [Peniophora sp. CBMAI 1063]
MRAAASVQGADLTLPQTILDRAAAPAPNVTYGIDNQGDDANESDDAEIEDDAMDAAPVIPPPQAAASQGKSGKGRALVADLRPVTFLEAMEPGEAALAGDSPSASRTKKKESKSRSKAGVKKTLVATSAAGAGGASGIPAPGPSTTSRTPSAVAGPSRAPADQTHAVPDRHRNAVAGPSRGRHHSHVASAADTPAHHRHASHRLARSRSPPANPSSKKPRY